MRPAGTPGAKGARPEDKVVCQLLASMAKDEVAEVLGMHRATLHRIVQRLREVFQAAGLEEYLE